MNPTFHRPCELIIRQAVIIGNTTPSTLFTVGMRYRENGDMQWLHGVYVPSSLQELLRAGKVAGIHIEVLEINGPTQRRLAGQPDYLVVGVRTAEGQEHAEVPYELQTAGRKYAILAGISLLASLPLLLTPYAWAGAGMLLFGQRNAVIARKLRIKPFWVLRGLG